MSKGVARVQTFAGLAVFLWAMTAFVGDDVGARFRGAPFSLPQAIEHVRLAQGGAYTRSTRKHDMHGRGHSRATIGSPQNSKEGGGYRGPFPTMPRDGSSA